MTISLKELQFLLADDSTGTESYFTTFDNFEIMFHVSTMLPLLPNDPSRVRGWP